MRDVVLSLLSAIRTLGVSQALSLEQRASLTEQWTSHALLEHASIASFSRFSLHLLAVSAPAALVERSHRAAIEEIEHAKLTFAIASHFAGGQRIGPGPLPLSDRVLGASDLLHVTLSAVEEGCIGETRAAITAHRQAVGEPAGPIRDVLALIADDEASHADLAFSFVAWACEEGGPSIARAVDARCPQDRELTKAWPELLAGSRKVASLFSRTPA